MSISRLVAPGREEELGARALARSELREEPTDTAPAVRWYAYAVEPGTYFLRSITEKKDYERYEGPREKTTAFVDRVAPGPPGVEALAGSDLTPVFRTNPGEAVYIGTFVVNLYTTDYGLGSRYVNNARKVYHSDPEAARRAIVGMALSPESFAAIDIFAGKSAGRRLYEREWRGRARFE